MQVTDIYSNIDVNLSIFLGTLQVYTLIILNLFKEPKLTLFLDGSILMSTRLD